MDLGFKGKTALVAASSQGLGRAVAEALAIEGANVMITSRDPEKLHRVKEEISKKASGRIEYKACDLSNGEEIVQLVEETAKRFGTIDLLVNNAGGPPTGTFEMMTDEDWQKSFDLNVMSHVRLIRAVLPYMRGKGGKIVNIASSSVKEPIPGLVLSNTFRLGIVGLTKTLAAELAPYQILINTAAPGRIATDRTASLDQAAAERLGISAEEAEELNNKKIPAGRYGTPGEFAAYVLFLLSEANTYMTGQTQLIDGGLVKSV
ncbi:SDR family oxidoreductase [Metabacillus indicus]|uniref:SDR family oxidoreductase n=1 Tax=Metabacillus indicus TaxID=246786 RepID=UPI00049320FF|nr:SDR family oxidoreductase [Metabacillus indicus]KEZ52742.1 3-oxoacyl-ACP reductase [Metabacillus indicus LMG 22858]